MVLRGLVLEKFKKSCKKIVVLCTIGELTVYFLTYLDAVKVKLKPKKHLKAVWLASNCHTFSERENYVRELQKFFPVDVYGKCGLEKCPDNENCYEYLAKNYMFYLSFENSICPGSFNISWNNC